MIRSPKKQRGLTFIELSLTLVLVGLIAALLAQLTPAIKRLAVTKTALLDEAQTHDAIVGFALATGRLPCADTSQNGLENCPNVTGKLPYLTLGLGAPLRNLDGHDYHYAVYQRPAAETFQDASLTEIKDRWNPTLVKGLPPAVALTVLGNNSHLDLCRSLAVGLEKNLTDQALYMSRLGSNEAVAYVLVNPGSADMDSNGSLFDGVNATGLGFEHPNRPTDNQYDDSISPGYFTTLWERSGCSALLSAAAHAHPNTLSTLAMFRQSMRDYKAQLELTKEMALADTFQAGATIAEGVAGIATAAATAPTATAAAINTAGALAPAVGASVAAIGLSAGVTASSSVLTAYTAENYADIKDLVDEAKALIIELDTLHSSVKEHTEQADIRALSNQ